MYINPVEKPRIEIEKRVGNNTHTHKEIISQTEDLSIVDSVELTDEDGKRRRNDNPNDEKKKNQATGEDPHLNISA